MTQIGYGNRRFDQFVLIAYVSITLAFFIATLFQFNAIWLALFMAAGTTIVTVQKLNCAYVKIGNGYFIVERLFRKPKSIRIDLYRDLVMDLLSVPFSNGIIIRFNNGEKCRIMGGVKTREEINDIILQAIGKK